MQYEGYESHSRYRQDKTGEPNRLPSLTLRQRKIQQTENHQTIDANRERQIQAGQPVRSRLIQLPSQRSRLPQQLLVLVLLHLELTSSLGADGMHRAVIAQTLHVRRPGAAGHINDGLGVGGGAGGVHVGGAHKGRRVRLVGAAAVGVLGLVDGQHGGVAGRVVVLLGGLGGGGGLVEGHWRRGRVERTQAFRELLDRDA